MRASPYHLGWRDSTFTMHRFSESTSAHDLSAEVSEVYCYMVGTQPSLDMCIEGARYIPPEIFQPHFLATAFGSRSPNQQISSVHSLWQPKSFNKFHLFLDFTIVSLLPALVFPSPFFTISCNVYISPSYQLHFIMQLDGHRTYTCNRSRSAK